MARGSDYATKRSFDRTPEPEGRPGGQADPTNAVARESFVIQQHYATRLHFDLRFEMEGPAGPTLVSWAVPKNLPLKKGKPHLAIHVEDHPVDYATFAGTIPEGNYGAGEVRIFDSGTYDMLEQEEGKLTFELHGDRLQGLWHMVRTKRGEDKDEWLTFLKEDLRPDPEPIPTLKPMLATARREAFDHDDWIFEPKWDGIRAMAVCGEETKFFSRNQNDVTVAYPELHRVSDRLVAIDAVIDGEIVAFEGERPSFEKLQSRIHLRNEHDIKRAMKKIPVAYIAFDLLYLDGKPVTDRPLEERKELLEATIVPSGNVFVSTVVEREGVALAEAARARGLEGIVAKKKGCPYRPGRRAKDWQKIKVILDSDVVVGGWSAGEGARSSHFGSLLVGAYKDGDLHFLGAVGTGFTQATLDDLMAKLKGLASDECPFVEGELGITAGRFGKPIRNPHWVEPKLVARIEFRELTSSHRLRAPSFKGLRDDKAPEECLFEDLVPA